MTVPSRAGINGGTVGKSDVDGVPAVGGDVRDRTRISLGNQVSRSHTKGNSIRALGTMDGVGRPEGGLPNISQFRRPPTDTRCSGQRAPGPELQGGAITGGIGDVGKLGVDDGNLKCNHTEAIVDRDQLRRFGAVIAIDGDVQGGALVGQVDGLACRGRGAGLVGEHPLSVRIAVLVRGLRRRMPPGSARAESEESQSRCLQYTVHISHAAAIACRASSRFASASGSER